MRAPQYPHDRGDARGSDGGFQGAVECTRVPIMANISTQLAAVALAVSFCSLAISFYFWRRSFRPIVTVAAKTNEATGDYITYDLVFLNSGTIPAKDIQITVLDSALASAYGEEANEGNKQRWLACFARAIPLLQNGFSVKCSFGFTKLNDTGFWKHGAIIPVTIAYKDWFGWGYTEKQSIQIFNSESFTGYSWD
jgi:uncharacterized repeat protein (TIGR01451 family)